MNMSRHLLAILFVLLLAVPAQAGTEEQPEILDPPTDTQITAGSVVPHLDMTKAWVEVRDEKLHYTIELAGAPELPDDTVLAFHYTWGGLRLFWMANWTDEGTELEFYGGAYQGTAARDRFDNTRYLYLPGPRGGNVTGSFEPGAPARVVWEYPLKNFGEDEARNGMTFTGMFVTTYVRETTDDGRRSLTMYDYAEGDDFRYVEVPPWYERLWERLPGPSVGSIVLAVLGVVALAAHRARRPGQGSD